MSIDDCVEWTGKRNKLGYGRLYGRGTMLLAHRVSWEAQNQRLLEPGEVVMHTCDNPPCINPRHLVVGTQQENMRDMLVKGRNGWPGSARKNLSAEDHGSVR